MNGQEASASFSGRNALVTGGTSGIGRAIALELAAAGCHVTATGVSYAEVAEFRAATPDKQTEGIITSALDVTNEKAVAAVIASFDQLDILVNSAGLIIRGGAEFEEEHFRRVLEVNLVGTMRLCVACRSLLKRQRGCIVNIASMLSFFGSGHVPAYSASKGGIAQLTKSLAIAWAKDGIRVNAVAPGWIVTPLTRSLHEDETHNRRITDRTPLARWGQPEDVTGAVLFLSSPAARFITGVVLPVDGGYSIM